MIFKTYNSIENAYQQKIIEQIILHGYKNETFVVQEKVHGANFAFYTNGKEVKIAKRTAFLEEGDAFYNAWNVLEKYREKVNLAFGKVKETHPEAEFIVIFGELFGGGYKHKEVEPAKNAVKVQKGVDYHPDNDFYAFDIKLNGITYLDVDFINPIFEEIGFFYAKTLFQGTLEDVLRYPNAFNTHIPKWFGLPPIENNICEGTIIKPLETKYFGNGSRVVLKNKNEKWAEIGKVKVRKEKREQKDNSLTPDAQHIWETLETYVTVNRLNAVISKEGEFNPKQMGKTIGQFAQDALTDFRKDHTERWETLEKEEQKRITKKLNNLVVDVIKQEYMTLKI